MSVRDNCLKHKDTWVERHLAVVFLIVIVMTSSLTYWLIGNLFVGFGIGAFIATWIGLRCLAIELYFTTVNRIRGGGDA